MIPENLENVRLKLNFPPNGAMPVFQANLLKEMEWLEACIKVRMDANKIEDDDVLTPFPPALEVEGSNYAKFVEEHHLLKSERLFLAVAIATYVAPNIFNPLQNAPFLSQHAKLARSSNHTSLLPTGETALFIIAGTNQKQRLLAMDILSIDHLFYQKSVLELQSTPEGEPDLLGILALTASFRELFIHNQQIRPKFNLEFPAELIQSPLEWEDLILAESTQRKLEELKTHLRFYDEMVKKWGMQKHARTGCRALFYGDSGTGKTLVTALLGKTLNKQVFRVDLSLVTSKYVGETSKRLRNLFNIAENKGWILFFDEGDALLGKRKHISMDNSASQFANQDTAFLLQRIDNHNGIVIVATNFRSNIDPAFVRRFEHTIKFSNPNTTLLLKLWQQTLPEKIELDPLIKPEELLRRFTISPAALVNAIYRACLMSYARQDNYLRNDDLLLCLRDIELQYKGRTISS